jgi:predicted peptidase
VGRLELPLPELGKGVKSIEAAAEVMQTRIRKQVPPELRSTIVVKTFKKGKTTGVAIEYDDRAENYVYMAMEYPKRK